jgi:hypothetical protein
MVNAKHLATFIMGAAAGVALNKYLQTPEGEKAFEDLKTKASDLKTQAEETLDKAPEYFEELKAQGAASLKEQFPGAEQMLKDLIDAISGKQTNVTEPPVEVK